MVESAIKSNEREAARLFQRGVAAARGGQKRVAAGLLARTVQLNPHHEMAWLWLSGVLDEPRAIAFCLRSVLAVNPHNERARRGLDWLEQRALIAAAPPTALALAPQPAEALVIAESLPAREAESWWVRWRRERRDMSRVRLTILSGVILLLAFVLMLNLALRDALMRNSALAAAAALAAAPAPPPTPLPTPPPLPAIIEAELPPTHVAQSLAYLSAIDAPRARLRIAVQAYRDATNQPGGSSVLHAAAARKLRTEIDAVYAQIEGISPPRALAQAHASYLTGLELERDALDDMLAFYGSFSIQLANRATLRMEDASTHFDHARAGFTTQQAQANIQTIYPYSAR